MRSKRRQRDVSSNDDNLSQQPEKPPNQEVDVDEHSSRDEELNREDNNLPSMDQYVQCHIETVVRTAYTCSTILS